jgi:fused signal recognition particle receptor
VIKGALDRFRSGLRKTRDSLMGQFSSLFGGRIRLAPETLDQIEELLIGADMGVASSLQITRNIERRLKEEGGEGTLEGVLAVIRHDVRQILSEARPRVASPGWEEITGGESGLTDKQRKQKAKKAQKQEQKKDHKRSQKKGRGKDREQAGRGPQAGSANDLPDGQLARQPTGEPRTQAERQLGRQLEEQRGREAGSDQGQTDKPRPQVVFVVGVNGTGKTTSIAKLAAMHKAAGANVLLAAADTFRAAAIEQLETWAGRIGVPCVRQEKGSDPAAVVFDALSAADARGHDVVIIDTAGRLHTKTDLMAELGKMVRVIRKKTGRSPETLLVVDANTGQNGLSQAKLFAETIPVDGLILAKLDGTAKGGIVVAIAESLGLPVKYVGTGERAEDLAEFDVDLFLEALFAGWKTSGAE